MDERRLISQRRQAIHEMVRLMGGVRVGDLVREFGVSEVTIRRDLEALAGLGLLDKVYGGAAPRDEHPADERRFAVRLGRQREEKRAIAVAAARLVAARNAIALSAGTTTYELARLLLEVPGLTLVTNSVPVADLFFTAGRADQVVVLTGGIRTRSDALVGPFAVGAVQSLNVDVAFLGVHGMSARAGFTAAGLMEAETDRALVAAARRLVVVADHTKWEVAGLSTVARLQDAHVLVTDAGLPAAARSQLTAEVGELVVAD